MPKATLRACAKVLAALLAVAGAFLFGGGCWLILLGGSFYYAIAGAAYVAAAVMLWRHRPAGAWLVAVVFAATGVWAVAESGLHFWPLFSRLLFPAGIATAALAIVAGLVAPPDKHARRIAWAGATLSAAAAVALFGLAFKNHDVIEPGGDLAAFRLAAGDNRSIDWTAYARTTGGTRFAPFNQINRENVGKLEVAWTFRSGDAGPGIDQNTPLQIGDSVYTCSRNDHIAALDADTGAVRWRYWSGAQSPTRQRCRSLGYLDTGAAAGAPCAQRLYNTTVDARLMALDARSGLPCEGFGDHGAVDLKQGMGEVKPGYYFQTSGPLVARGWIVVGGWVADNRERGEPSGVIRAFDVLTGALAWAWDLGDPSMTGLPPPGRTYTRGTPNMWTHAAYDDALGLVYAPLGNETPDYFGMGRLAQSDRYNSALVALDIETGRERWHVQTVHHDIWDYDLPSQPALVDLPDGHGGVTPAVMQTTKRGQIFLLNRATGGAAVADRREAGRHGRPSAGGAAVAYAALLGRYAGDQGQAAGGAHSLGADAVRPAAVPHLVPPASV